MSAPNRVQAAEDARYLPRHARPVAVRRRVVLPAGAAWNDAAGLLLVAAGRMVAQLDALRSTLELFAPEGGSSWVSR